jgi:hypothetical protein
VRGFFKRQFNQGDHYGHHSKLLIVREGESNSGETSRGYGQMRRVQISNPRNG